MSYVTELRCVHCGAHFPADGPWPCSKCGGILDVHYDLPAVQAAIERDGLHCHSIERYRALLPLAADAALPPQPVGWTPIIEAPRLAAWAGVQRLRLKDDGRNPTASFKDRASAIGAAHAVSLGFDTAACASTGNAASSLAGMAAGLGIRAVIFIPETAPEPKVTQLLAFGATVIKVRGGYAGAYDLCTAACRRFGWYDRNCAVNPFLVEGKKTCGLEIGEQCADHVPEWVAVSVGDGCTIAGIWKGLKEMHTLGILPRLPRLLGVQADGARPIADAFEQGTDRVTPVVTQTIADSIDVGTPRNDTKAIRAVREADGTFITVSDAQILEAVQEVPRLGGVFGEPAGVAGVAGIRVASARGLISSSASVLCVVTGNGLKDVTTAKKAVGQAHLIDADITQLEAALGTP